MVNLDLLFTSAGLTGNTTLSSIAIKHADTTIKNHFRGNHSTWHVVHYNSKTGAVTKKVTSQGYADWSTWSRGQSWAMYGYGSSKPARTRLGEIFEYGLLTFPSFSVYNRTKYQRYLDTARGASKLYLDHLPTTTYVPPWLALPLF